MEPTLWDRLEWIEQVNRNYHYADEDDFNGSWWDLVRCNIALFFDWRKDESALYRTDSLARVNSVEDYGYDTPWHYQAASWDEIQVPQNPFDFTYLLFADGNW